MIEINWSLFKVKFYGKENSAFERLAYMLFCFEHNVNIGIFRFKNQTGIETEPIGDDNSVGFQAKYYDTRLSDNKQDIIDSIKKAKAKNPSLTKILLYVNQELSESSNQNSKKPEYQKAIENAANLLGLQLDWRVQSHMEIQLSKPENLYLAQYFFTLEKNIVDFLSELRNHSKNILYAIQTSITFNDQHIKVDRSSVLKQIQTNLSRAIIIAGQGGSGKTAIIKDFFETSDVPIYVFKAAECNINNASELFKQFGDFTLGDFVEAHRNEKKKILVIDSAEKLSDLDNQDPFKEILSSLIQNNWTVLFTTRFSYLDDLSFQLFEVYRLSFSSIKIDNLTESELNSLSVAHNFKLPNDKRLQILICNLFYLREYLENYQKVEIDTNLSHFRDILWKKKIQRSVFRKNNIHLERERCFLEIAKNRATSGHFYTQMNSCSSAVLSLLEEDEIIKYDSVHKGYFITHDIYEEWGLNQIIETEFQNRTSNRTFFQNLGTSLSIRRAFRLWLSEKLIDAPDEIKIFIERSFTDSEVTTFWKDELIVSVMGSEYARVFFQQFERMILENHKQYLKKIIFLLRIGCKEVDNSNILNGASLNTNLGVQYIFTKPKGAGWQECIKLINRNVQNFKAEELEYVLPLLQDWNDHNQNGETTRLSSLSALHFYKDSEENKTLSIRRSTEEKLIKLILTGSAAIKEELTELLSFIIKNINSRKDAYWDLAETILASPLESIQAIKTLPEQVITLANKSWYEKPQKKQSIYNSGIGVEQYFGIKGHWHHEYFPASSYQTPVYWLLIFNTPKTIRFIIDFVNRVVETYAASGFDNSVSEIEVTIGGQVSRQYISPSLWSMHRGTGSPVSPYMLQSIHMALEKYLIEITPISDIKIVQYWLIFLLKNTRSASITAVVTNVVLSYPNDMFEVAIELFKNLPFLQHDNWRLYQEHHAESLYRIGAGMNHKTRLHEQERIQTLKQEFRKKSLELLAVQYQMFKTEDVTDEIITQRQQTIWQILDDHYKLLPDKEAETDHDKSIKLLLARIDSRKMNPTLEKKDGHSLLHLNPVIDEDLKAHSEKIIKEKTSFTEHTRLKMWGINKFEPGRNQGNYPEYDNSSKLVLKETKIVLDKLKKGDPTYWLFNHSTPAYTAAALLREYNQQLSQADIEFCKQIIFEFATAPFGDAYDYQIGDGVEVAVNAVPFLYPLYPKEQAEFNVILLLIIFDEYPIGQYKRVCDYAIESILHHLHKTSAENANKILFGLLLFKDKFDNLLEKERKNVHRSRAGIKPRPTVLKQFLRTHKKELLKIKTTEFQIIALRIKEISFRTLESAFQLIPAETQQDEHLLLVKEIIPIVLKNISPNEDEENDERDSTANHTFKSRFLKKFARFLLYRKPESIEEWLGPFTGQFIQSEEMSDLLTDLISIQDDVKQYDNFWIIWKSLYPHITSNVELCDSRDMDSVLRTYLLAWPYWSDSAKEWHTLRETDRSFYRDACKDMGKHPVVLYSIAKVLNSIASPFLSEGILWISDMLKKHTSHLEDAADNNTIYYLELVTRKYVYLNRTRLKSEPHLKHALLVVLEYLVSKGSVSGYLLREDIL